MSHNRAKNPINVVSRFERVAWRMVGYTEVSGAEAAMPDERLDRALGVSERHGRAILEGRRLLRGRRVA